MSEKGYYLIFGAQMVNKGAQAMLFITVSEIRKRDPDAEIVVFIYDKWKSSEDPEIYNMRFVPITMKQMMNLSGTAFSKAYVIGKRAKISKDDPKLREIDGILSKSVMAFDISGYALSDQWGVNSSLFFLSKFAMLEHYNIPSYILPQSFGPFNYGSAVKNALIKHYTKKYLKYPKLIFAREKEGYDCLTEDMGLKNVRLSNDLVLQSNNVDIKAIYRNIPDFREFETGSSDNVAIIPNSSNDRYGDSQKILKLYDELIKWLLERKKNIYLLSHSSQDLGVCKKILENYKDEGSVHLIEADLNCIEYGMFIRKFDYIIASRFHSIVNAFKEHIPCIALGWAVKYEELLDLLGQKQFNFDVRALDGFEAFFEAAEKMDGSYSKQSEIIKERLAEVQKSSCFKFLDDVIKT